MNEKDEMIFILYNEIFNRMFIHFKLKMKKFKKGEQFLSVEKSTLDNSDYSSVKFSFDTCSFCDQKGSLKAHVGLCNGEFGDILEVNLIIQYRFF
jgi:hypothetical protein